MSAKLAKAQGLLSLLNSLWKSHNIGISTKLRLLRSLVWPVAFYGCESCILKSADEDRINAFEMKDLRQLLHTCLVEGNKNEWILQKANRDPHIY